MTQEFCEIRYVHIPTNWGNASNRSRDGYTIAYTRNEVGIYFTWVQKHKKDQYDRSIGRSISCELLTNILADICDNPEIVNNNFVNYLSVNKDRGYGYLTANQLVRATVSQNPDIKDCFADHITENLTCMDFKHKHISIILKTIVDIIVINENVTDDDVMSRRIDYDYTF